MIRFTADIVLIPVIDEDQVEFLPRREVFYSWSALGSQSHSTHFFILWDDDPDREPRKIPVFSVVGFDRLFFGFCA